MAELLIQSESLTNIADSIRKARGSESLSLTIDPTLVLKDVSATEPGELHEQLTIYYWEWFDLSQSDQLLGDSGGPDSMHIYRYFDFKKREDNGMTVPVLYAQNCDSEYKYNGLIYDWEPFYYEGQAEMNGKTYDKWRNIEVEGPLSWNGTDRKYMYTDIIVVSKNGLTLAQMPEAIEGIVKFVTFDATARTNDILEGKTAWVNGEKIAGAIPTKDASAVSCTIEFDRQGETFYSSVTVPQGYYSGGDVENQVDIPVVRGATVTPSATQQTIVRDTYVDGEIKVNGDPWLSPIYIKRGVSIFGVEGTYDNSLQGRQEVAEATLPYIRQSISTPITTTADGDSFYNLNDLCESTEGLPASWGFMSGQYEPQEHCDWSIVSLENSSNLEILANSHNDYFYIHLLFQIIELSTDQNQDSVTRYGKIIVPPGESLSHDFGEASLTNFSRYQVSLEGWRFSVDGN